MPKTKFGRGYTDIVAIRLEGENKLVITFRNGDEATVSFADLIPFMNGQITQVIDWVHIKLHKNHGKFVIPVSPTLIELNWTTIRQLTDPKFRKESVMLAKPKQACICRRLRTLRKEKGVSLKEVAVKSGLTQKALREWEEGSPKDNSSTTLWKILGAMGCTPEDLAEPKIRR